MPEFTQVINGGLVAVLALLVWKLPEIVRETLSYMANRQAARDTEVKRLLDTFKTELRYEREQSAEQFKQLMFAVEKRACGFVEHLSRHDYVVPPLTPSTLTVSPQP